MKETNIYTEYHPRWHRKRMSTYWWISQWKYLKFILRELSSIAVAYFTTIVLMMLFAMSNGEQAYGEFQQWLKSPLMIAINAVAFLFTVFHTITWFNAAPRAVAVRVGGKRLSDAMVAAPNYVGWLVVSAIIAWLILRG